MGEVTVVIACYSEDRWDSIRGAVRSVQAQQCPPVDIVVVVDHNRVLAERIRREIPEVIAVSYDNGPRGASGARNAGVERVSTPITAFLDDDEAACPDWLEHLVAPFADPAVVGTGGRYRANWVAAKPGWFPDEFGWVVGDAFLGLPTEQARVRNVWSGNMAVRTAAFRAVGGFRVEFGKQGETSQPEDTDLCIRMAETDPGSHWIYVPDAVIDHTIPPDRGRFGYFLRRCYLEGKGKVELGRDGHRGDRLGDERNYVATVLTRGMRRYLVGPHASAAKAAAVLAGIGSAGTGAFAASVRLGTRGGPQ
ncbi:glycosyltransferase [Prescottella subtropica]|uniref:glycosyltransferase n=1 Tax=Prescottella subtropica TaxID=2545757 RepID=UPI0013872D57|nr:glycosyltransferase [Prescottella subtropica]